jgi:hypothetical protein
MMMIVHLVTGWLVCYQKNLSAFSNIPGFSIDINCQPEISREIQPYAYWVHSHRLGTVVSGYRIDKKTGLVIELSRWSHRWPQPVKIDYNLNEDFRVSETTIRSGDFVAAKCTYNSTGEKYMVNWGPRKDLDEMCNLFIFYFSKSSAPNDLSLSCVNEYSRRISLMLPSNADSLSDVQGPLQNAEVSENNNFVSSLSRYQTEHYSPICKLYRRIGIDICPY